MFWYLMFRYSAKVALGELLRLCPGSAGLSTLVEKAKTDYHDKARAGRCSRGFFESLKTYASSGEEPAMSGQGMDTIPNSIFRILGASPKFKIIDFYGQVRVIKPNSPIALFAALDTSFRDQVFG